MNYVIIVILALLFPGLGNIYIKDYRNGLIYIIITPLLFFIFLQYLCFSFILYCILWLLLIILRIISIIQPLYIYSKNKQSLKTSFGFILIVTVVVLFLLIPFNNVGKLFKYRSNKITSKSMMTTLNPGDRFVGNYKVNSIKNGDIIIFEEEGNQFISRCIAQEGDVVSIKNSIVYVNNAELNEPYSYMDQSIFNDQDTIPDVLITLADYNRYNSDDSRFQRMVNKNSILGKPIYFYYSKDRYKIGKIVK